MHQPQHPYPHHHGAPYGPSGHGYGAPPPPKRSNAKWWVLAAVFASCAVGNGMRSARNKKTEPVATQPTSAGEQDRAEVAAPNTPKLPPEPSPLMPDKASEVPQFEAKLAQEKAYQGIWEGRRDDLNLLLTTVSEGLANDGSMTNELADAAKKKKLFETASALVVIQFATGKFPDDFMQQLTAHLEAVKGEAHLGTWSPRQKGKSLHDYTALAAWVHRDDVAYLRERIAAKAGGDGPQPWARWEAKDAPARPWLATELGALERLAILGGLDASTKSRMSYLREEAKRPRQPGLGEEFTLGDFAYVVKSVGVRDAVGSGYSRKRASEDARFVVVDFSIRNDGNRTKTVMTDDFRIVDARGREYRPSSEANTALAFSRGKDLILSELQPGLKKSTSTAFEVPQDVANGEFTLVIPEKGLFGSKSVRIALK